MDIRVNDKVKPLRGRNKDKEGEVRSVLSNGKCYIYFGRNNYNSYVPRNLEVVGSGENSREDR